MEPRAAGGCTAMSPDDGAATESRARLAERYRLPAAGARAIAPFTLDDRTYLAITQLAYDAPGSPAARKRSSSPSATGRSWRSRAFARAPGPTGTRSAR